MMIDSLIIIYPLLDINIGKKILKFCFSDALVLIKNISIFLFCYVDCIKIGAWINGKRKESDRSFHPGDDS